ncbi:MAG: tetratricopeptide repeat protein [Chloroflexota bacterium]
MDTPLKVSLLGRVEINHNNQVLPGLATRKAEALLFYLICNPTPQPREVLADLFFQADEPSQARRNLTYNLYRLRQPLDDYIVATRQTLAFNHDADYWLDVSALDQAVKIDSNASLDQTEIEQLATGLSLYQGDFLAGFYLPDAPDFEDWVSVERERLVQQTVDGYHRLIRAHSDLGNYPAGIEAAKSLIALDPLDEEANTQAMRLMALNGQRGAAIAQYEALQKKFDTELGATPSEATTALYEQIQEGAVAKSASLVPTATAMPTVVATPTEVLPPPHIEIPPPPKPERPPLLGEFVGRGQELTYFTNRLNQDNLAVISGMAGVGKTALAITLAEVWQTQQLSSALPDQARIIDTAGMELEQLTQQAHSRLFWHRFYEGEGLLSIMWKLAGFLAWNNRPELWQMLQTTQQTGGQLPPPSSMFDYVLELLRGQGYLLCLDDVHWIDDDPLLRQYFNRLEDLITGGEIGLIITSRQVPDYFDFTIFDPLSGLSQDDVKQITIKRRLILEPDLIEMLHIHTEGNAQLLNLAITVLENSGDYRTELEYLSEADNIERYLIREIDDELSGREQEIMVAVAVLLGYPGSRDAIETIIGRRRTRRMLRELADRHLLVRHRGEDEDTYSAHAILRAFYYDQPSKRELRQMHRLAGEYYELDGQEILRAATHYLRAEEQERSAALITVDVNIQVNQGQISGLQSLLKQFVQHQLQPLTWAKINIALGRVSTYTYRRVVDGNIYLAEQYYQTALDTINGLPNADEHPMLVASIYYGLGLLYHNQSPQKALTYLEQGLPLITVDDSPEVAGRFHGLMGELYHMIGQPDTAIDLLQQALDLLPPDSQYTRLNIFIPLIVCYFDQGDIVTGRERAYEALAIAQHLNATVQLAKIVNDIAVFDHIAGDLVTAQQGYEKAITLARQIGAIRDLARNLRNLAELHLYLGDVAQAQTYAQESLQLGQDSHLNEITVSGLTVLAAIYRQQNRYNEIESLLMEAETLANQANLQYRMPEIYIERARLHIYEGNGEDSLHWAKKALALAKQLSQPWNEGLSYQVQGEAYLIAKQPDSANDALARSLTLLVDDPYEAASTKLIWGQALVDGVDVAQGLTLLEEAKAIFASLSARSKLKAVNVVIASVSGEAHNR